MARRFACGRPVGKGPRKAIASDGQTVLVGASCHRLVRAARASGFAPPLGGPRLFMLLPPEDFRCHLLKLFCKLYLLMRCHTNKYCVYAHHVDGKCIYIGKGKLDRPLAHGCQRNSKWNKIILKNKNIFDVKILGWTLPLKKFP